MLSLRSCLKTVINCTVFWFISSCHIFLLSISLRSVNFVNRLNEYAIHMPLSSVHISGVVKRWLCSYVCLSVCLSSWPLIYTGFSTNTFLNPIDGLRDILPLIFFFWYECCKFLNDRWLTDSTRLEEFHGSLYSPLPSQDMVQNSILIKLCLQAQSFQPIVTDFGTTI